MFTLILGLGRTGTHLAQLLLNDSHQVAGTCRAGSKRHLHKDVIPIVWDSADGTDKLPDADIIVCAFPPTQTYPIQLAALGLRYPDSNIIQISSTAVFGQLVGELSEDTPPQITNPRNQLLYEAEQIILSLPKGRVVRAGGLYDEQTHPVQFLSGKSDLPDALAPVNLVHRQDLAEILFAMITGRITQRLVHAVHPEHPLKIDYYSKKALEKDIAAPTFSNETHSTRIIKTSLTRKWRAL